MPDTIIDAPAPVETPDAPPPVETPPVETPPAPPPDELGLDEGVLATLTPESRTVLDPVIKNVRDKWDKIKSEQKTYSEKAQAFDKLVSDPKFVNWYRSQMNPQAAAPTPPPQPAEEVTDEMLQAVANDPVRYAEMLEKRFELKYGQQQKTLEKGQKELRMGFEFDALARAHPDLWDLDKAGLFEPFLYFYTDLNRRPMIEAYNAAKKVGDFFSKKAEAAATGLVANRKVSVTEPPTNTPSAGGGIVYAQDGDEALRMQIMENLPGGLKRQVVIKR